MLGFESNRLSSKLIQLNYRNCLKRCMLNTGVYMSIFLCAHFHFCLYIYSFVSRTYSQQRPPPPLKEKNLRSLKFLFCISFSRRNHFCYYQGARNDVAACSKEFSSFFPPISNTSTYYRNFQKFRFLIIPLSSKSQSE